MSSTQNNTHQKPSNPSKAEPSQKVRSPKHSASKLSSTSALSATPYSDALKAAQKAAAADQKAQGRNASSSASSSASSGSAPHHDSSFGQAQNQRQNAAGSNHSARPAANRSSEAEALRSTDKLKMTGPTPRQSTARAGAAGSSQHSAPASASSSSSAHHDKLKAGQSSSNHAAAPSARQSTFSPRQGHGSTNFVSDDGAEPVSAISKAVRSVQHAHQERIMTPQAESDRLKTSQNPSNASKTAASKKPQAHMPTQDTENVNP